MCRIILQVGLWGSRASKLISFGALVWRFSDVDLVPNLRRVSATAQERKRATHTMHPMARDETTPWAHPKRCCSMWASRWLISSTLSATHDTLPGYTSAHTCTRCRFVHVIDSAYRQQCLRSQRGVHHQGQHLVTPSRKQVRAGAGI